MKLRVEIWKSSQNQQEVHLFVDGLANTYVLGWNPALVDLGLLAPVLLGLGISAQEFLAACGDGVTHAPE